MNYGKSIKAIRRHLGITQGELCDKANLSQSFLSQIESDKKTASPETLEAICEIFKIPFAVLAWFSLNEAQVDPTKREAFKTLQPAMDALIHQVFGLKTESEIIRSIQDNFIINSAEAANKK